MKIRDYYDRVADERTPNYQESSGWMDALVHGPNERFVQRTIHRLIEDSASIADLGCGTGEHLLGSFRRLRRLFLNDLSPKMLASTVERVRAAHPGVEVASFCGKMDSIPTETEPCEAAICLGVLNHIHADQLPRVAERIARLATKTVAVYYAHEAFLLAGKVGSTFREMDIHYEVLERARLVRLFRDQGLDLVRSSYPFLLPLLSPLIVQEFRVTGAARG